MPEVAASRSEPVRAIDPGRPSRSGLLGDLDQEQQDVMTLLDGLGEHDWATPTTPGWTVRDQIAHLAYFDAQAATSIRDPRAFTGERHRALADIVAYEQDHLLRLPAAGGAVLAAWRAASARFRQAAAEADPAVRLQWFGPEMGLFSMITARLMETWAHGQDVADGLAIRRAPTDRLRHVVALAVRARAEGYRVRGLAVPEVDIRVDLISPSGSLWTFGQPGAGQVIHGTAEDFCLVLVRRRHVEDTALRWDGEAAGEWLRIGQAYAGPPGEGPRRLPPVDGHVGEAKR